MFRRAEAEAAAKEQAKREESVEEALARLSAEAKYQSHKKDRGSTSTDKKSGGTDKDKDSGGGFFNLFSSSRSSSSAADTDKKSGDVLLESLRTETSPQEEPPWGVGLTSSDPYYAQAENDKSRALYPERGGAKYKSSWWDVMMRGEGREGIDKIKCERNVYKCLTGSPLVKLLLGALKSSGCDVNFRRHISCEVCDHTVTGGYDPFVNQVVVCQNTARSLGSVQGVLTHELIHMFDFCRHKLDLNNVAHLACTEIRAANLAHCSFLSAWTQGTASPFSIRDQHRACVKERAFLSVKSVRNISDADAVDAVEAVFEKCYADLEPIGRRIRRNSDHIEKAYLDRQNVGYF